jgi:hypothetical protein
VVEPLSATPRFYAETMLDRVLSELVIDDVHELMSHGAQAHMSRLLAVLPECVHAVLGKRVAIFSCAFINSDLLASRPSLGQMQRERAFPPACRHLCAPQAVVRPRNDANVQHAELIAQDRLAAPTDDHDFATLGQRADRRSDKVRGHLLVQTLADPHLLPRRRGGPHCGRGDWCRAAEQRVEEATRSITVLGEVHYFGLGQRLLTRNLGHQRPNEEPVTEHLADYRYLRVRAETTVSRDDVALVINIARPARPSSRRTYPTRRGGATPCEVSFCKTANNSHSDGNTSPIPRGRVARTKVRVAAGAAAVCKSMSG